MTEKYDFSNMFLNAEIKPIPNLQAELKPCPFCGEIPKHYQYRKKWCVECHSSKCWVVPETDLCSSKEEATEKWNTRAKERGGEK